MLHEALLSLALPLVAPTAEPIVPADPAPAPQAAQQGGLGYLGSGDQGQAPPLGRTLPDATSFMKMRLGDLADGIQHPKDAGLRRAFALLDDRLAELPREFPMPGPAEELFTKESLPVWLELLRMRKSMAFGISPSMLRSGMGGDMPPFVFSVALEKADAEGAAALAGSLGGLLERMEAPVPPGLYTVEGNAIVTRFGMEPPTEIAPRARQLAGDGDLGLEMEIDVGAAVGVARAMMQAEGAPPEAMYVLGLVERLGLADLRIEVAQTTGERFTRTTSVMTGVAGGLRAAGILPEEGIRPQDLAPIPVDATMASVQRFDPGAAFSALNGLASEIMAEFQMEGSDPAEMVRATMGIDLEAGLFGALGDTVGYYSSLSTGGGGLTSTVFFASLRDVDALTETKEQIEGLINGLLAPQTRGYVSIRPWESGDVEYTSLMFPGIPVPLEPTIAMNDGWLVIAATPQAALSAMAQIESGNAGLGARADLASLADGTKNALGFVDAEHFAKAGYGGTCILAGAVANAVRSPMDASRDAGPIVPLWNEFQSGISPIVTVTEILGDDMVSVSVGDSSMLVQTAVLLGFMEEYLIGLIIPAGAMGLAAEEMNMSF
ncbi:MAG: hypothetical protein AAFZ87_07150 [Planctomycetota bacterium]